MIKMITKIFKERGRIQESEVTIEVTVPEETRETIFDAAVAQVVDTQLREALTKSLCMLCWSPEEIKQTEEAIAEYGTSFGTHLKAEVRLKYPKIYWNAYPYYDELGITQLKEKFELERLVDNLVKQEDNK